MIKDTEEKEHAQGQKEVYQSLHVFGEEEKIFGYVDLGEDAGVAHKRRHALRCRFVEIREHQSAAKQVCGVMQHVAAEKLRENQLHDQQQQQRRKHAPGHTKYSSFIFLFEIPLYQFFKQELVFRQFLKHKYTYSPTL